MCKRIKPNCRGDPRAGIVTKKKIPLWSICSPCRGKRCSQECCAQLCAPDVAAGILVLVWTLPPPFSHLKDPRARLNWGQGRVRPTARANLLSVPEERLQRYQTTAFTQIGAAGPLIAAFAPWIVLPAQ